MLDQKERRHHPRVGLKMPVVQMTENGLVNGEIQDLSLGGAFVRCPHMVNPNDRFHMVISAWGRLVSIIGEVVWQEANKPKRKTALPGMGVCFRQILHGDRRFLRDVIASHDRNRLRLPRILRTNR